MAGFAYLWSCSRKGLRAGCKAELLNNIYLSNSINSINSINYIVHYEKEEEKNINIYIYIIWFSLRLLKK